MKIIKIISNAIRENFIPIILGCIIFPSVFWLANNVDNPNANPYARGGTLNPINKIDSNSKRPGNSSFARSTRTAPISLSTNCLLLDF